MGMNEVLLFITALLSAAFVYIGWKINRERLYGIIIVFLILISIVGVKTVEFFGFETNTGNIFYASVFLATYFLIERYGKRDGMRSIWVGAIFVAFFTLLLRISLVLIESSTTAAEATALREALSPALRLAVASLSAYIVSQFINVHLYVYLKQFVEERYLWLRANFSNMVAQFVDSAVFFTIAFWGVTAPSNIWSLMLTGYFLKTTYMMLASPLLYLNKMEVEDEDDPHSSVTIRH